MFASKRAEVGSTLEGSSVDAACDCDGAFLSAMSSVLQTVYGISAPKNGANRTAMAGTERLALTESPNSPLPCHPAQSEGPAFDCDVKYSALE